MSSSSPSPPPVLHLICNELKCTREPSRSLILGFPRSSPAFSCEQKEAEVWSVKHPNPAALPGQARPFPPLSPQEGQELLGRAQVWLRGMCWMWHCPDVSSRICASSTGDLLSLTAPKPGCCLPSSFSNSRNLFFQQHETQVSQNYLPSPHAGDSRRAQGSDGSREPRPSHPKLPSARRELRPGEGI